MNANKYLKLFLRPALLAISGLAMLLILPAQKNPTFRSGVFLVHIDAGVLESNNRTVTGLSKDDFRVFDAGQEQTIVAFSEGEQPLDLILLFDTSGSMRRQIRKVTAVAQQGLHELRPNDCVAVMVFSDDSQVVADFSNDAAETELAIRHVLSGSFAGRTRIQDAVGYAASRFRLLENRDRTQRAILVVTDNLGIPARHKATVIDALWEADTSLNGIVVKNHTALKGLLAPLGSTRPGGIEDLVEQSGGDLIRSDDLTTAFPEMMHRIRSRYTIYYRLPESEVGSLRRIDVQLSNRAREHFPGARILTRRGDRLQERDRYGFSTHY